MDKPPDALRKRNSGRFGPVTWFKGLHWMQKLLVLMLSLGPLLGGWLWVSYNCCYWPFEYNPFPEPSSQRSIALRRSVARALGLLSNYVPDTNPDAAALSALTRANSVVRADLAVQFGATKMTNTMQSGSEIARCLFSRSNRIDRVPQTFWTNTPFFVLLYTTNGPVMPPILYDPPREIWRFGNYYFSLKGPTNFAQSLHPGYQGIWEWPRSSD
jgi:hypothetical protein